MLRGIVSVGAEEHATLIRNFIWVSLSIYNWCPKIDNNHNWIFSQSPRALQQSSVDITCQQQGTPQIAEPRSRTHPRICQDPFDRSHGIPRRRTVTHENATTVAKSIVLLKIIVADRCRGRYVHACWPDLVGIEVRALDVGIPCILRYTILAGYPCE